MSQSAVLGTGAMGSRMARNLLTKGQTVRVWNRTQEKTSPLVAAGAGGMLADDFAPLFPIELVEKDLDYAVRTAAGTRAGAPMASAAREVYRAALSRGDGDLNITGVARLYH